MDISRVLVATVVGGAVGALIAAVRGKGQGKSEKQVKADLQMNLLLALPLAFAASFYSPLTNFVSVSLGLKTWFEIVAMEEGEKLHSHPKFNENIEGMTVAEARDYGASLSVKGLPLLELNELDEWVRLKLMMAQGSQERCAEMWNGGADFDSAMEMISELPDEEQRVLARISAHAGLKALENSSLGKKDLGAVKRAISQSLSRLPASERKKIRADASLGKLPEVRACRAMIGMLTGVALLPDGDREEVLQVLVGL